MKTFVVTEQWTIKAENVADAARKRANFLADRAVESLAMELALSKGEKPEVQVKIINVTEIP